MQWHEYVIMVLIVPALLESYSALVQDMLESLVLLT